MHVTHTHTCHTYMHVTVTHTHTHVTHTCMSLSHTHVTHTHMSHIHAFTVTHACHTHTHVTHTCMSHTCTHMSHICTRMSHICTYTYAHITHVSHVHAHTHTHTQAANLLQAAKKLPEEAQAVFATCPKLNSRQIDTLLHHCSLSEGDMAVNQAFAKELILLAQAHTDEALKNDGMEIKLEEDPNLELPFLVPQQGYSCDTIRGMPPGLQDYLEPMISAGRYHHSLIAAQAIHHASMICEGRKQNSA